MPVGFGDDEQSNWEVIDDEVFLRDEETDEVLARSTYKRGTYGEEVIEELLNEDGQLTDERKAKRIVPMVLGWF